jgi:hypothetical protein
LLALGEAHARSGETAEARATFLQAGELARRLDMPERAARAAVGYGGRYVHGSAHADPSLVPILERALAGLPAGCHALRSRLLARLAGALAYTADRPRAHELAAEAVENARLTGDAGTLAYALGARLMTSWGPDTPAERVSLGTEIVHLAQREDDLERLHQGHMVRVHALIELGDRDSLDAELSVTAELTDRLRQPPQQWYAWGVLPLLALLEGRFRDVPGLIERVQDVGRRLGIWNAPAMEALQRFLFVRETGEADELEALAGDLERAAAVAPSPIWRCVRLNADAMLGRAEEARREIAALVRDGKGALDSDALWWGQDRLLGAALAAEACGVLGGAPETPELYRRLLPYRHLQAVGTIEISLGSAERYLGMLAAADGRLDDACAHLEAAVEANGRMRARPWVARTLEDRVRVLEALGHGVRAEPVLAEALATYEELGMSRLAALTPGRPGARRPSSPRAAAARR